VSPAGYYTVDEEGDAAGAEGMFALHHIQQTV